MFICAIYQDNDRKRDRNWRRKQETDDREVQCSGLVHVTPTTIKCISKLTRRANSHGSQMVNDHKDVFDHIQVVKLGQLCETITLLAIVVIKGE